MGHTKGSNPEIDFAISKIKSVNEFLMQDVGEKLAFEQEIIMLMEMFD